MNKIWLKLGNNFSCDYFLKRERKIVNLIKKTHFVLMFQTMIITKTHQYISKFPGHDTSDRHFVLSAITGHSYHTFNYFIHPMIPILTLNHEMIAMSTSSQNALLL